jgi:uncharacterized membrane protein
MSHLREPSGDHPVTVVGAGMNPGTAAALSYLAWRITGLLFLLLERRDRFVRFHAMQSVLGLGGIFLFALLLLGGSFVSSFLFPRAFDLLFFGLYYVVLPFGIVVWGSCLTLAYLGKRWRLPLVGRLAERLTDSRS